jgi:ribosome recycling factor
MKNEPFNFVNQQDSRNFENEIKAEMESPIKHFEHELVSIRTGRASTSIVEDLKVECYGQMMSLKELATLSTPDAKLITIQPWDKSIINSIEKAVLASDVGITPINDGELIRLQLPQMSSDRREELVKVLSKKTEECKIGIRNVRKDYHNQLRDAEKKRVISEDFAKRLSVSLQKVTDSFTKKADEMHDKKAKELGHV